jgi:hypothetical protein
MVQRAGEKYDKVVIVALTEAQRKHLDYVAGSTATMSEVIRMALAPLTPEIVREMKILDLKRQADEIARANVSLSPDMQQTLPGPFRVKRKYKRRKRERAGAANTGPRGNEVGSLQTSKSRK